MAAVAPRPPPLRLPANRALPVRRFAGLYHYRLPLPLVWRGQVMRLFHFDQLELVESTNVRGMLADPRYFG